MKVNSFKPKEEPKTKVAALNLAAQVSFLLDSSERRRLNLMKLESEHKAKIAKLQEKLEKLIEEIQNINSEEPQEYIKQLQLKHSLTESEILETKSEILRRSIESKQARFSELTKTGETTSEGNSP